VAAFGKGAKLQRRRRLMKRYHDEPSGGGGGVAEVVQHMSHSEAEWQLALDVTICDPF